MSSTTNSDVVKYSPASLAIAAGVQIVIVLLVSLGLMYALRGQSAEEVVQERWKLAMSAPKEGEAPPVLDTPAISVQPTVEVSPGEPVQPIEIALSPDNGQTYYATLRAGIRTAAVPKYVDWSPDGQWILTGGPHARLYSVKTGELTRDFGETSVTAFHPNGKQVIGVEGKGKGLVIWDVTTGKIAQRLPGPSLHSLYFTKGMDASAGGEKVVCSSYSSAVLFDLQKGKGRKVEVEGLASIAVSPDGKTLAVGTEDGKLLLLDADTLSPNKTLVELEEKEDLGAVAFSPDGKLIAGSQMDSYSKSVVRVWDVATGMTVAEHEHSPSAIDQKLAFSPDGKAIGFCSDCLRVDNALGEGTGKCYFSRIDRGDYINDFAFAPQGTMLAAVPEEDESYVFLYDLNTTRQTKTRQVADSVNPNIIPLPDGETAIQVASRATKVVNLDDGAQVLEFKVLKADEEAPADLAAYALSADSSHLIGTDYPKTYWWKVADGTVTKSIETTYALLTFSSDGNTLLGYREDYSAPPEEKHQVHLMSDGADTPRKIIVGVKPASIALSADGKQLAVGGDDAHLRLFDVAAGDLQHRLLAAEGPVTFANFSPDGKWLVTGAAKHDNQPALWDLRAAEPQPTYLDGHDQPIMLGAFSPDGATLITVDGGGKMILWNVSDPQNHIAMPVGDQTLRNVALTPDRKGFTTLDKPYMLRHWAFADLSVPTSNSDVLQNNPQRITDRPFVEFSGFAGEFDEISFRRIRSFAVSQDEKWIATSSNGNVSIWALDKMLAAIRGEGLDAVRSFHRTWDFEGQYVVRRFPVCDKDDASALSGIAFSQDGSRVLTTFESKDNGQIAIWDVATGKQVKSFPVECEYISLAASPTSDIVAVVPEYTNSLRLFDLKLAEELPGINTKGELNGACFDPTGKYLVIANRDIDVYEFPTRQKLRTITSNSIVDGMAVSPNGQQIFLGADVPEILNFQTGAALYKGLHYSAALAGGAAFSPDSQWVASHQMYHASEHPIFYNAGAHRELSIHLRGEDPYFTRTGDYVLLTNDDDVQFVRFASLTDEKLQKALGALDVVDDWYWDGKYLVLRFPVRGRITRAQLGQINKIPAPVKLNLSSSSHLSEEDVAHLAGAKNLRGVFLPHYCPAAVLKTLARCPNMEELAIYTPDEAVLAELSGFPNLRCLTLFRSEAPAEAFAVLGQLSKLEGVSLDIHEGQGGAVLEALAKLPNLKSLRVDWPDASAGDLEKIGQLPSLIRLSLSDVDNLNTNEGLTKLSNIRELQLQDQRDFNEVGLKLLKGLDNLEGLDMFGTGVTAVDELLEFRNLKWLRNSYEGSKSNDMLQNERPELRLF